jgi:hypothetical protein
MQFSFLISRFIRQPKSAIVGFNLPFDISRIASDWAYSNGEFENGFTFFLQQTQAKIKIKHLSSRKSLFKGTSTGSFKSVFVDVMTLSAAMYGRSFSLDSLAKVLQAQHQKIGGAKHGTKLTEEYLDYLIADVLTTQDCYNILYNKYLSYGLDTPINNLYSEASLGKAYLKQIGIKPLRTVMEPSEELNKFFGIAMSTYYGGRSEVKRRRQEAPIVYTDFLSMYPTVNTKMGLWRYVIAKGLEFKDYTSESKNIVQEASLVGADILRRKDVWEALPTFCKVKPDQDIFPVRAKYGKSTSYNIGVNYITSETPMWYTLADCISSTLLAGKPPTILEAVRVVPMEPQEGLSKVNLFGNSELEIDPYRDDFFKKLIELRKSTNDSNQKLGIKIVANSTCYGIFVEIISTKKKSAARSSAYYSYSGKSHPIQTKLQEEPGIYFNPMLATFITSAARLLLASTERLAADRSIDWAFCDTDSMAFISDSVSDDIRKILKFYEDISPYSFEGSILKLEDVNDVGELLCYAVSSKRYVLYTRKDDDITIHKASSHGLGYLSVPYGAPMTETGAAEWVNDLWKAILSSKKDSLGMMKRTARSQLSLNTAYLHQQFVKSVKESPSLSKVLPFSFLSVYQRYGNQKTISPLNNQEEIIDAETGRKVDRSECLTYGDAIGGYEFHPESKFILGDLNFEHILYRRHVYVDQVTVIGKETSRIDPENKIDIFTPVVFNKKRPIKIDEVTTYKIGPKGYLRKVAR